jgi:iron complex outermembrane recepter protein
MNKGALAATMSLLGALSAVWVQAEESPGAAVPPERSELQEIIVTARRKEERQQNVPLAITTLSGEFLKENAIVGLHDLNGKVPGLNIENFNSPAYTNVGIRGQRNNNIAPGQDAAVGYYISEVSYAYPVGINEQLFDLQALEVVKGPQGTLFGRNTTGGAILISPAKPVKDFEGSVAVGVTSFHHGTGYYTTGIANLPVNDALQFRAAVNVIDHDGYVKNLITAPQLAAFPIQPFVGTSSANLNNESSKSWRLSALLTPTAQIESYFLAQGSHHQDHGVAYSLTAVDPKGFMDFALGGQGSATYLRRQSEQSNDFWTTESGLNAYNRLDNTAFSNTSKWTISDSLLAKNVIGYRHFKLDQAVPLDGVPFQILDSYLGDRGHELSEELQLQGSAGQGLFDWVAGYYYSNQHLDHPRETVALPQFGGPVSHATEITDNSSYAEYGQATVKIAPIAGLSLTGGIRNTRDVRKMTSQSWNDPAETSCAISGVVGCELAGNITYSVVTYNVSLNYQLDADTLIYLTRRKGYRAGGWNYVGSDPISFGPFKPEYVNDWEAGLKRDWHFGESALRSNLAVYRSSLSNAQKLLSPVSNPNDFEVINAASATIKGGELELTFVPVKGLEFGGYLSLIDAKFQRFVFGGNDFTNNSFAQTPKTQYSLRAKYDLPLVATAGIVALQADYTHQSHIFYTDTAEGPAWGPARSQGQDAYGILNLRVDWNSILQSKFDAAFYVKNATQTQYNSFGVMLYTSLGYNIATIGAPRIFGLEGTFHF